MSLRHFLFRPTTVFLCTSIVGLSATSAAYASNTCSTFQGSKAAAASVVGVQQATFNPGDVIVVTYISGGGFDIYNNGGAGFVVTGATTTTQYTIPNTQHLMYTINFQHSDTAVSWTCWPGGQQPQQSSTTSTTTTSPANIVAQQSAQRVQAILANQLGSSRQVDRLMDFGSTQGGNSGTPGTPGTGFTADEKRALDVASSSATAPRLGLGLSGSSSSTSLSQSLGLRATLEDDLHGPLRTRGSGYGDSDGGGLNLAGLNLSGSGGAYNFSTSLRDVARTAQQQEQQRLAEDPAAAALGFTGARSRALDTRANPLDVWIEGRFVRINDGREGADIHGYSGLFGTGVDYVFNRSLLAGISLSYDVSSQKSSSQSTAAKGTGWLVGPYATVRLGPNLFWQSRLAAGRASNDVSPNLTVTDSFGSNRWLATSKLTGRYQSGPWQLRPSATLAYMEETSDSYVSGTGTTVDNVKTRVGTASAGPEISYQYRVNPNVLIEPRVGAEAIWTFARDISVGGNSAIVSGETIGPAGVRGRVELGLRTMIVGGTVIDLSGAYDGIGVGDYNNITGRAVLRLPLN